MKIKEVIVPKLQGLNINHTKLEKYKKQENIVHNTQTTIEICSENGFYTYHPKKGLIEIKRKYIDHYCVIKQNGSYVKCKQNNSEDLIFINIYEKEDISTNSIPLKHTNISIKREVIKLNNKSHLELIVETYDNIQNKIYFNIYNDFSLSSKLVKDELNTLISFLQ